MANLWLFLFCLSVAYLVGALPFGYWVGRWRGVNLFEVGSGNIGATNAGRVLGWRYGVYVFILDFTKGAMPPLLILLSYSYLAPPDQDYNPLTLQLLQVGMGAAAFVGHLFPLYLGFRGGKGIATGAGTIVVLAPEAAAAAILVWGVTVLATRYVSVASLVAAIALLTTYLWRTPQPWQSPQWPLTLYLSFGSLLIFVKHRNNLMRLWRGCENRLGEWSMRQPLLRILHVLSLGVWFGGAFFFNFVMAPTIFRSFEEVVQSAPTDRTAYEYLLPPDAPEERRKALASALAGSAVGPIFPRYFALQFVCALVAATTAAAWWSCGRLHRWRLMILVVAALGVTAGWPLSDYVSELRSARFSPEPTMAETAREAFSRWHSYSLLLNIVTTVMAGSGLILAAWMPVGEISYADSTTRGSLNRH